MNITETPASGFRKSPGYERYRNRKKYIEGNYKAVNTYLKEKYLETLF